MADDMDDAEFWLPSEFLADDFFTEDKNAETGEGCPTPRASYPLESEFPYGYASNLSSLVESVTERESDQEDYMAGLTRQMAHSLLDENGSSVMDTDKSELSQKEELAGSPQSTLCAVASWSAPSSENSNGPSQVSSPPSTPSQRKTDDAWDLLYAAAGEVVRLRLNEGQQQKLHGRGLLGRPRPLAPVTAPSKNPSTGYFVNPSLTQNVFQVNQFQQLKQQQLLKQHSSPAWGKQNKPRGCSGGGGGFGNDRCSRTLGLSSSAWPPLQPQQQSHTGSGMRAVFLGGSGSRRESCGTGVFLPRRDGNPTELRKKPACSTVLLPARVVQALNLNLDDIGAQPCYPGGFVLDHDAIVARSNAILSQKKALLRPQPAAAVSHEIRLPPEWTY